MLAFMTENLSGSRQHEITFHSLRHPCNPIDKFKDEKLPLHIKTNSRNSMKTELTIIIPLFLATIQTTNRTEADISVDQALKLHYSVTMRICSLVNTSLDFTSQTTQPGMLLCK